jgi:hypothetical protein
MFSFINKIFNKQKNAPAIVSYDEELISCTKPNGTIESVKWKDLKAVLIETTDEGPFACDVFWVLLGSNQTGCVIPQGATGESELLKALQDKLPAFNNEALLLAMASTQNNRFIIWEAKAS